MQWLLAVAYGFSSKYSLRQETHVRKSHVKITSGLERLWVTEGHRKARGGPVSTCAPFRTSTNLHWTSVLWTGRVCCGLDECPVDWRRVRWNGWVPCGLDECPVDWTTVWWTGRVSCGGRDGDACAHDVASRRPPGRRWLRPRLASVRPTESRRSWSY